MLPKELVDILVCPKSKAPLVYFPRGEQGQDEAATALGIELETFEVRVPADFDRVLGAAAAQRHNVRLEVIRPDGSEAAQTSAIKGLVGQDYSGVAVSPNDLPEHGVRPRHQAARNRCDEDRAGIGRRPE